MAVLKAKARYGKSDNPPMIGLVLLVMFGIIPF